MIQKITKQHLEATCEEPVYKVVRDEGDRLRSLWVDGTKKHPQVMVVDGRRLYALTYKEDRVVSNGVFGIWCCKTLVDAREQARGNGYGRLCRIYQVRPIGECIIAPYGWGDIGTVLYPAVIMGKLIESIDKRR